MDSKSNICYLASSKLREIVNDNELSQIEVNAARRELEIRNKETSTKIHNTKERKYD